MSTRTSSDEDEKEHLLEDHTPRTVTENAEVLDEAGSVPVLTIVGGKKRESDKDEDDDSTYGSLDLQLPEITDPPTADPLETTTHGSQAATIPATNEKKHKKKLEDVRWRDLPRKDQLLILLLARLAEPLAQTSMQAYVFYMLKSFDTSLTDSDIATQAGLLSGSFTLAQCISAVWWGRLADKEWMGRKNVLLIGLLGTFISTLGFAFARSFAVCMICRLTGGLLNGNVGVMRTLISEIIKEKKYQPKAFLILPVTFNVGVLIGPALAGWLQDPVSTFPHMFGPNSVFGGEHGVRWMIKYPYALPNLVMASVFIFSISLVFLGLEETHIDRQGIPDRGLEIGCSIARFLSRPFRRTSNLQYQTLDTNDDEIELAREPQGHRRQISVISNASVSSKGRPKLPFRRMFTRNVIFTFMAQALLHLHVASFNNMWFLFLSTPRAPLEQQHGMFSFAGGLGLPPATIGLAIGLIGVFGLCLQFGVYARIVVRLGIVRTYQLFALFTFPLVYLAAPYLAIVPTSSTPPHPADGPRIWLVIAAILFIQVVGRTFVLPLGQVLTNNCCPHPSVLSSIHGIGQSISSGARTLGPVIFSSTYGLGLRKGMVGLAWWLLAVEAVIGASASWLLSEGNGHEIVLDGD